MSLERPEDSPAHLYAQACSVVGLGERSQQLAIVEALCTEGKAVLALEAPTGTGKSLGALFGAAARVTASGASRVAVATYTNVLREQYIADVDRARRAFPRVRFATVAGAGAYTCRNRAREARTAASVTNHYARADIDVFLRDTDPNLVPFDGLRTLEVASLDDQRLARYVRADTDECATDDRCKSGGECGLFDARRGADDAQVVITNHALLAVNARAGGGVIGGFDAVVIDEVHRLGEALRSSISHTITARTLGRGRTLLDDESAARLDRLTTQLDRLEPVNERFVSAGANGSRSWEDFAQPFDNAPLLKRALTVLDDAKTAEKRVFKEQRDHVEFDHHGAEGQDPRCKRCRELRRDKRRAETHQVLLGALGLWLLSCLEPAAGEVREYVGTVSRYKRSEMDAPSATLTLTPVDTTDLSTQLVGSCEVLVCVSATVGCTTDDAYALSEAGLVDHLTAPVVHLPPAFDYPVQMVGRFDTRSGEARRLVDALELSGGRALVLTRSHTRKDHVADLIEAAAGHQLQVYAQPSVEDAATRGALVRRFTADETSILVGTRSYYEGIDVPGDALRHVIILDRPYVAFGPLQRQLDVNLRAHGRTWKNVHHAPQVEMTFEQIAGRLIRSRADSGWVSYLDADQRDARWFERRFDRALARFGAVHCAVIT